MKRGYKNLNDVNLSPQHYGTVRRADSFAGEAPDELVSRQNPKTGEEWSSYATLDNFVTAKGPNFNKIQQASTGKPQTLQHQWLRINKNP
jgi:hypothetical protein